MNFKEAKKLVTRGLLAVLLLFGVWSVTASSADAQRRVHGRVVVVQRPLFFPRYYPRTYTVYDPIAYQREQGYSDGLSRGKDDAKHGRLNDPASHKHFSESNSITYRDAFAQGYADGYNERIG
jgi:hypothetical protein